MKKLLILIFTFILIPTFVFAQLRVLRGPEGGTNTGTASSGDIGNCLKVASFNPLVWTIGTCGGGGGAGTGTVATSTALVSGQVDFSTGASTIGNDPTFLFDTTLKRLTASYASTTAFTVSGASYIPRLGNLTSNGFVKTSGGDGTLGVDTNTYLTGSGAGVTAVSVSSANGFAGSSSGGATPALTLTTSISGLLKGNGTAISAGSNGTDYTLITAKTCSAGQHVNDVTAAGVFTCTADSGGSGGGTGNVATSTSETAGFLPYWTSTSATPATLGKVATTTLSLSGFPANIPNTLGSLVGGSNTTWTWWGLATTSQPASSNILTSNGGAGVYGTATSTLTPSSPLTGSFVQIGSGGSLGCTTAASGVAGCLSNTSFDTFNNKQATISVTTPITLTGASVGIVNQGTTAQVLHGNASGNASFGAIVNADITNSTIDLTTKVTGALPVANGGTNATSFALNSIITSNAAGTALIATSSKLTVGSLISTTTNNSYFLGNLGIGTTSPQAQVHISTSTAPQIMLTSQDTEPGFAIRVAGGIADISTTSPLTNATSTLSAVKINGNAGVNLGFAYGTTTPFAVFSSVRVAGSAPLMAIGSSTAVGSTMPVFALDSTGQVVYSGPNPTLSSCGTSPSYIGKATDLHATIQVGSVSATTCTHTFTKTYASVPICNVTGRTGTIAITYAPTASAIVITNAALTSDILDINCSLTQ